MSQEGAIASRFLPFALVAAQRANSAASPQLCALFPPPAAQAARPPDGAAYGAGAGRDAGKGGGPERRRAAPSLRVPGGVSVQPCLAARGGEAGSVGGALCEAAAAESGGGGHSCRRAGISAADGEPRGGGGRQSRLPLPTGSPAGESRTWVAGAGGHG